MALLSSKGVVVSLPVLVLSGAAFSVVFLFFLLSSPPPCNCPVTPTTTTSATVGGDFRSGVGERISTSSEDIEWVKKQIEGNGLHMAENVLRKGINPRTREQQLQDLLQYVKFSICVLTFSIAWINMWWCAYGEVCDVPFNLASARIYALQLWM